MPTFWQAIKYLENINLKVIAATADGVLQNGKVSRMYKHLVDDLDTEILN